MRSLKDSGTFRVVAKSGINSLGSAIFTHQLLDYGYADL
jgi:hypothetical protein